MTRQQAIAMITLLAAAILAVSAQRPSLAQVPGLAAGGAGDGLLFGDRAFARKAAVAGLNQAATGALAGQRASHAEVRQFAERVVREQALVDADLRRIAAGRNLVLPAAPEGRSRRQDERMGRLAGAEFDRLYMDRAVDGHKKAVGLFKQAARSTRDEALRAFAVATLPKLQEQERLARSLRAAVEAIGDGMPAAGAAPVATRSM